MDPQDNNATLHGINIAVLVTDGFEQVELTEPLAALEEAGASTTLISVRKGKVRGYHHDTPADEFTVALTFEEADPDAFNALLLPGGKINGEHLRNLPQAQDFLRSMQEDGKPIAAICHGPWLLSSTGLAKGRTVTSSPDLEQELRQAGANWVDQEAVRDDNLVTSRKPADIPAFNQTFIGMLSERVTESVRGTPDERPDVGASS